MKALLIIALVLSITGAGCSALPWDPGEGTATSTAMGPDAAEQTERKPPIESASPEEPGDPTDYMIAGAIGGSGAGLAAGLASCTPALFVPMVYPACVTMVTLSGAVAGAFAGGAIGVHATTPGTVAPQFPEPAGAPPVRESIRTETEGPLRVALAPPRVGINESDSQTGGCDMDIENDFVASLSGVAGVSTEPTQPPLPDHHMEGLWSRGPGGAASPDIEAVVGSGTFSSADAVMFVKWRSIGGWYCIHTAYDLL